MAQEWKLPELPDLPFPELSEDDRHLLFLSAINDPVAALIDNLLLLPFPFLGDAVASTWSDNIRNEMLQRMGPDEFARFQGKTRFVPDLLAMSWHIMDKKR